MGCCFGSDKGEVKEKEEPLVTRGAKEEKDDVPASPPPALSEKKKGKESPKKEVKESPKKETKAPKKEEKKKAAAKEEKPEKPKKKEEPAKKEKAAAEETKKPAKDDVPPITNGDAIPEIDDSKRLQGRGGELPPPPAGTTNISLHGKPTAQADTKGKSEKTSSRLKRANNCVEDCRPEVDIATGKMS